MNPGVVVHETDVRGSRARGDTVEVFELIKPSFFAEPLVHRSLRVSAGASADRSQVQHDEFLYVLEGSTTVHFSDNSRASELQE